MSCGSANSLRRAIMCARAQATSPFHISPIIIRGVSWTCRTWHSCQTNIVSKVVPIPPRMTTKALERRTKWWSRVKNVRWAYIFSTNGLGSSSLGSSMGSP
jgi:hypothetical protein